LITSNIERTKALLNGDIDRWRVHIKTAKLGTYKLPMNPTAYTNVRKNAR
jgi:hypothetical protein